MNKHREALAAFRELKSPMGVLEIRHRATGRVFLDAGLNLPALENRNRFTLNLGTHPNRALQADWNTFGEPEFGFAVLGVVDRDPDQPDRDYRPDVAALLALWIEEKRPFGAAGYHEAPVS